MELDVLRKALEELEQLAVAADRRAQESREQADRDEVEARDLRTTAAGVERQIARMAQPAVQQPALPDDETKAPPEPPAYTRDPLPTPPMVERAMKALGDEGREMRVMSIVARGPHRTWKLGDFYRIFDEQGWSNPDLANDRAATRSAVYRLVKKNYLERLNRGRFRERPDRPALPTWVENP